jgi:hypothetical protein
MNIEEIFTPLPRDKHLIIKDSTGSFHEFYIDEENDNIVFNIVTKKNNKEIMTSVILEAPHVYDVYKLFETYLKTPILEEIDV